MDNLIKSYRLEGDEGECPAGHSTYQVGDTTSEICTKNSIGINFLEVLAQELLKEIQQINYEEALNKLSFNRLTTKRIVSIFWSHFKSKGFNTFENFEEILINKDFAFMENRRLFSELLDSILTAGIRDIFTMLMIHINYGINEKECKDLLYKNMRNGKTKKHKNIAGEFDHLLLLSNVQGREINKEEIIQNLNILVNKAELSDKESSCPYGESIERREFIETIWKHLKTKFLPALQDNFNGKKIGEDDKATYFYLGKLNEIE